jgi:hypothetical protein
MLSLRRNSTLGWILIIVIASMTSCTSSKTAGSLSTQTSDPLIGSWKLNVEKSTYSPGPPPKSGTITYEPAGAGIKVTTEGVDADGTPTATYYTANWDVKDYPITGSQTADTVSLNRIDEYTTERTDKKDGKVVGTLRRVVSQDGRTLTITTKSTNAKGQAVNNVIVYEKQ